MTTISSFSDASKAFYELYDPPAQEIDPTCCYCMEECALGDQRTMICRSKGGLIEHETHLHCQKNWAEIKSSAGAQDGKIHCQYNGVCTTNLAHLLPRKSFLERTSDFFRKQPAVQILTYGAATLGVNLAIGSTKSMWGAVVPLPAVVWQGPIEGYSGLAALFAVASGKMEEDGSSILFNAIGMGASIVAGKLSIIAAGRGAPRNVHSSAAATAAVVFASTLIHGGNLFSAATLSLMSWGSAIK